MNFSPQSLDLVAAMQTLDHLDRPGRFLEKTTGWLRQGGVLFLSALVNLKSAMFFLFRDRFRLLHPYHLVYFTPEIIRRHLSGLGFRVIKIDFPYFHTPYFNAKEIVGLGKKLIGLAIPGEKSGQYSPPFYTATT